MNISVIAQTLLFLISCVSKVSSQGICPEKWSILGGRCYRFFRYHDPLREDRTWPKARSMCMSLGSDLVSINNEIEDRHVDMARQAAGLDSGAYYWIGLTDMSVEGTFMWLDGTKPAYTNWLKGEPDSDNPTDALAHIEDHVVASGSRGWSDVRNDWTATINYTEEPRAYVCERAPTVAAGPRGVVGFAGPRGTAGPTGESGPVGLQGAAGDPGPPGSPGPDGAGGPPGVRGPHGAQGPPGRDGSKGSPGEPGVTGNPGLDGAPGMLGSHGPPGTEGPAGRAGERGMRGVDGPPGREGLQGKPGNKGDTGDKGDQGSLGERGQPGQAGVPGSDGRQGDAGPDGKPGTDGALGADGQNGSPGVKGDNGDRGPVGDKGPLGGVGPRGAKGDPGARGVSGYPGLPGDKGNVGDPGVNGVAGIMGPVGPNGTKGSLGDKGEKGDNGAKGPVGSSGPTGPQGPNGVIGDKGPTGDKGLRGDVGVKGPAGTGGQGGERGIVGLPGPPGPPGPHLVKPHRNTLHPVKMAAFINATAFCLTLAEGVYPHPLHCWQFVTCGPLFGGYREHSCYAGRRFLPHAATCVKDATCVFGAPSHNISAKAYALKQKVNQLRKNPDLLHVKKNVTLYMGITAFMMVVMATLVVAVVRLYVRGQKAVCGSRKTSQNSLTDTGSILTQQV